MKKVILMAIGAVVLFRVAKKYGINSLNDISAKVNNFVEGLNLKEYVNVDKLKQMVTLETPEMATA